jgi:hypothetical protein
VSTMHKLKKGLFMDAIIGYIEGREVAGKLRKVNEKFGDFVINLEPYCLSATRIFPDVDAVYISNKDEIEKWAVKKGLSVSFPYGKESAYNINGFIVIKNER